MAKRKKKGQSSYRKKWQRWVRRTKKQFQGLMQKLGCFSLFLLVLIGLVVLLAVRYTNYTFDGESIWGLTNYYDHQQKEAFIIELAPTAQRLQREYGVLASISLAQAAIESDFGRSQLATDYYNLYGVKTDSDDLDRVDLPTLEYYNDQWHEIDDAFKVYPSWEAAMTAHAELIYYGTTWNQDHYEAVLQGTTPAEQAYGLQKSGYATDPDYADKLLTMINEWDLHQYDQPLESEED